MEVFDYLGKKSDYKFTYNSESVKSETKKITESFKNVTLQQILAICLENTRFSFEIVGKNVVISLRKEQETEVNRSFRSGCGRAGKSYSRELQF
ncbi:MAG: STN domain-containing protein [Butyricimonas faecihominis]